MTEFSHGCLQKKSEMVNFADENEIWVIYG